MTALVAMGGILVGVLALTVILSVMNGLEHELQRLINDGEAHVELQPGGSGAIVDVGPLLAAVEAEPGVAAAAPFVRSEVLVVSRGMDGRERLETATLTGIDQTESVKAGHTTIDSATLRLTGADLPVGAMFEAGQAVAMATGPGGARRPVPAALLLDGFMGFGRFGLSTEGSGLSVVQIKRYPPPSEEDKDKDRTEFTLGYDRWSARLDLSGLRDNAGTIAFGADFAGGQFLPGPAFRDRDRPHVEAWFPLDLRLQSRLGGLNEGFLRTLLTDVTINRLDEPVELILPMALYFMATVFDVTSGDDLYRTGLFEYTQQGQARLYPTKMLGVVPYEGEARVTLSGIDRLNAYFAGQRVPEAASVLTVLRNLGRDTGDGRFAWDISRPDIERSELVINGTTLRYPDLLDNLPMMMGPLIYGRTRF